MASHGIHMHAPEEGSADARYGDG
ncbi:hypothetical protein ACLB1S_02070 [Escherichia coli]